MDELISRGAAIRFLSDHVEKVLAGADVSKEVEAVCRATVRFCVNYLKAVPAAGEENVVHCIDCANLGFKDFRGYCESGPVCGYVQPDSFCSWGRKKDPPTRNMSDAERDHLARRVGLLEE